MSTLCPSVSVTVCVLVDEVVELVGVAVSLSEEGASAQYSSQQQYAR